MPPYFLPAWLLVSNASSVVFSDSLVFFLSSSYLSPPWTMGREGRMVVLSLVLGLSEQDDFANIPDLQTNGSQQNQHTQGEKR